MQPIHAFRIAVGPADPGFTDDQLSDRDREAQQVAEAFMPSLSVLRDVCIQKRWVSEEGVMWRAFDLVLTPQLRLELTEERQKPIYASAMLLLHAELGRLKQELDYSAVRIGELAQLASLLPSMDPADALATIENLPKADRIAWQLIHRHGGTAAVVQFGRRAVTNQLPLLPLDFAERGTRVVSCQVGKIGRREAELIEIQDQETAESPPNHSDLSPKRLVLLCPNVDTESRHDWFLLYLANYERRNIDLQVRMARRYDNLAPSHFELIGVRNRSTLSERLSSLTDSICAAPTTGKR